MGWDLVWTDCEFHAEMRACQRESYLILVDTDVSGKMLIIKVAIVKKKVLTYSSEYVLLQCCTPPDVNQM